jgi:hypothetical protein
MLSRRFLAPLILLATLAFSASPAEAGNILQNPGFETGDFTGWDDVFSCCPPDGLLTVTGESPHSGAFVADFNAPGSLIDPQTMALGQSFPAISTEDVNEVSYWMRSTAGDGGGCQFRAMYSDGTFTASNCPAVGAEWQKVDVTGILTPGKLLSKILILNGSPPETEEANRDFFDDFVVDAPTEATFNVSKDFSDDNPAGVSIEFACSNGNGSVAVISETNLGQFVINDFDVGVSCSITEFVPDGYTVGYSAGCDVAAVANGGVYDCAITNTQNPVTILAAKSYDGEAGPGVAFEASCEDGTLTVINGTAAPGTPAEFELSNFPYDGTTCSVTEPVPPAGYSQAASTCEGLTIVPSDSATNCEITNAEIRSTFWVTKAYSDGNDDEVEVTLSCNSGLPLEQSFLISDGHPVNFVITNFTEGEVDCEVTETGTADGYTPSYDNGSVVSDVSCAFTDVASGAFSCAITNNADPATFTVYKEWVIEGAVGHEVLEEARVTIYCNNEIQGGGANGSYYYLSDTLVGDGDSLTATVDTTLQSAQCWAEEDLFESGVESENDCGSRSIPAGGSSSCTFTNTVFFEGIPTLSQYGMAIMALLMLGLGFVGLRRFV